MNPTEIGMYTNDSNSSTYCDDLLSIMISTLLTFLLFLFPFSILDYFSVIDWTRHSLLVILYPIYAN